MLDVNNIAIVNPFRISGVYLTRTHGHRNQPFCCGSTIWLLNPWLPVLRFALSILIILSLRPIHCDSKSKLITPTSISPSPQKASAHPTNARPSCCRSSWWSLAVAQSCEPVSACAQCAAVLGSVSPKTETIWKNIWLIGDHHPNQKQCIFGENSRENHGFPREICGFPANFPTNP